MAWEDPSHSQVRWRGRQDVAVVMYYRFLSIRSAFNQVVCLSSDPVPGQVDPWVYD
jgi:hypothetical protein